MLKYDSFRSTIKYKITPQTPKLLKNNFYFFFSQSISMSGKNINFEHKKSTKVISTKIKNYSKQITLMLKKKLVSKKQPYGANNSIEYFIGYNDDDVIILIIMSFKVADDKLLKSTPKYEKKQLLSW